MAGRTAGDTPEQGIEEIYEQLEDEFEDLERALDSAESPLSGVAETDRERQLEILLETSQILNFTLDLNRILDFLLRRVLEVSCGERAFVLLASRDGSGSLEFASGLSSAGKSLTAAESRISKTIAKRVVREGEGFWATDIQEHEELSRQSSVESLNLRTVICAPLTMRDTTFGVVYVDSQALTSRFSKNDYQLLEAIAHHAAAAIEHARLFKDVTHDPVTGLHNYGYFQMRIGEEFARARRYDAPCAVLLAELRVRSADKDAPQSDLDAEVLQKLARRVQRRLRKADILARYDNKKLGILLPGATEEEAKEAAKRFKGLLDSDELDVAGHTTSVVANVGVVTIPHEKLKSHERVLIAIHEALREARAEDGAGISVF